MRSNGRCMVVAPAPLQLAAHAHTYPHARAPTCTHRRMLPELGGPLAGGGAVNTSRLQRLFARLARDEEAAYRRRAEVLLGGGGRAHTQSRTRAVCRRRRLCARRPRDGCTPPRCPQYRRRKAQEEARRQADLETQVYALFDQVGLAGAWQGRRGRGAWQGRGRGFAEPRPCAALQTASALQASDLVCPARGAHPPPHLPAPRACQWGSCPRASTSTTSTNCWRASRPPLPGRWASARPTWEAAVRRRARARLPRSPRA